MHVGSRNEVTDIQMNSAYEAIKLKEQNADGHQSRGIMTYSKDIYEMVSIEPEQRYQVPDTQAYYANITY